MPHPNPSSVAHLSWEWYSLTKGQRNPAPYQAKAAQWRHRTQYLKSLRIKHKQVDAATEHGHSCNEQRGREGIFRGDGGGKKKDAGVDKLKGNN
jgi:hypothetical protein